jgi:DHA1 family multidrug resistance protein-like MFS transporter
MIPITHSESLYLLGAAWHRVFSDVDNASLDRNWSRNKKLFVSFQICLMTFSVYLGASLITASETGLQEEFGISRTVSVLSLSLYILG